MVEELVIAPSTCNVEAISTAPSMSTTSKLVVPSTSRSPLKSALPASVSVVAISTAPSISTTSRFAVPFTSIEPSKSMSPFTMMSSVTVRSSSTLRSTTFKLAKASATAAPEPAPSK